MKFGRWDPYKGPQEPWFNAFLTIAGLSHFRGPDAFPGCSTSVDSHLVRQHVGEHGYQNIPAAIDADASVAVRVQASVTPETVVIDRAGAVRYRGRIDNFYVAFGRSRQVVTVHDLRDALDAVLAGKPVPAPVTEPIGCFIVPASQRSH